MRVIKAGNPEAAKAIAAVEKANRNRSKTDNDEVELTEEDLINAGMLEEGDLEDVSATAADEAASSTSKKALEMVTPLQRKALTKRATK